MSSRVGASGDRIVQTLKGQTAPSSGFSVRMEYEIERAEPVPILRVTSLPFPMGARHYGAMVLLLALQRSKGSRVMDGELCALELAPVL